VTRSRIDPARCRKQESQIVQRWKDERMINKIQYEIILY
jgi:hypothetical protein